MCDSSWLTCNAALIVSDDQRVGGPRCVTHKQEVAFGIALTFKEVCTCTNTLIWKGVPKLRGRPRYAVQGDTASWKEAVYKQHTNFSLFVLACQGLLCSAVCLFYVCINRMRKGTDGNKRGRRIHFRPEGGGQAGRLGEKRNLSVNKRRSKVIAWGTDRDVSGWNVSGQKQPIGTARKTWNPSGRPAPTTSQSGPTALLEPGADGSEAGCFQVRK